MLLKDKVAIVTGAARNVGRGIALRFAREGARVIANDVDGEALDQLAADNPDVTDRLKPVQADISDPEAVRGLIDRTADEFGSLDILVNNAVVRVEAGERGPFLKIVPDAWHAYISRNLDALFNCTQAAAHIMCRQRCGSIINVSSNGAVAAHREMIAYDTLKGGMESFTRSVAVDLAPWGVRVNTIRPIVIRDEPEPGTQGEAFERHVAPQIPIGRVARPADAAWAAVFLASDEAGMMTGEVVNIDGGMLVQSRPPQLELKPVVGPEELKIDPA